MNPAQTADCLIQIGQLADRLRAVEPTIRRRAETTGRDGYPPTSGPGGGHRAGGDPVGNLVALRIDDPRPDLLADAHVKVLAKIRQARRLLEEAEGVARQAMPPPVLIDADGCISCARIKRWSPIHRTRLCSWCYSWVSTQGGEPPPIDILHAHHDGRRVTVRLIAAIHRRRAHG